MVFPNYPRTVNSVQEILDLADKYQIPLKQCRFFINQDIQEPRAFGIYNDGIKWIVYKNKANGERAIRYQGEDEAYAAQEIWSKFLSEVDARRESSSSVSSSSPSDSSSSRNSSTTYISALPKPVWYFLIWLLVIIIFGSIANSTGGSRSHYGSGSGTYYQQSDDWGTYDNDWDSDWDDWDSSDSDWDSDW